MNEENWCALSWYFCEGSNPSITFPKVALLQICRTYILPDRGKKRRFFELILPPFCCSTARQTYMSVYSLLWIRYVLSFSGRLGLTSTIGLFFFVVGLSFIALEGSRTTTRTSSNSTKKLRSQFTQTRSLVRFLSRRNNEFEKSRTNEGK